MLKIVTMSVVAGGLLCAGCATYTERVVEKPVPATTTRSTTYVTEPSTGATTTYTTTTPSTTVYTTR